MYLIEAARLFSTRKFSIGLSYAPCMGASSSAKAASKLTDVQPAFIYGTAWKKGETKRLVKEALSTGFRRVDTAAQPRHYQEALVGDALREAFHEGIVKREDLYVQTKYTSPAGQDHSNMPYHPLDPLETQIHTSLASSFRNLAPDENPDTGSYINCVLLHSPLPTIEQTLQAWKLLESYVPEKIGTLGISNVDLPTLKIVYENATVKPSVVQNRFYPQTKYDIPLRAFCADNNITYQSFWTLSGNPRLLKSESVTALAKVTGVSNFIALYALVMDLGIMVLNGTTSAAHMKDDLDGIVKVRDWAATHEKEWTRVRDTFSALVTTPT